jgi:predicted Zn-dependent peptidase
VLSVLLSCLAIAPVFGPAGVSTPAPPFPAAAVGSAGPLFARVVRDTFIRSPIVHPASGGPALLVYPEPSVPLVALRLVVPIPANSAARLTAGILQNLARARFAEEAGAYGAVIQMDVGYDVATYVVIGPAASFDGLATTMRRSLLPPRVSAHEVDAARAVVEAERVAADETPEPLLRRRLDRALFAADTAAAKAEMIGALELQEFWAQYYRSERMRAVVVGGVRADRALAAFRGWPAVPSRTGGTLAAGSSAGRTVPNSPQVLFRWVGLGFPAADIDAGILMVAAELVQQRLHEAQVRAGQAEVWLRNTRRALVIVASETRPDTLPVARPLRGTAARVATARSDAAVTALARVLHVAIVDAAAMVSEQSAAAARQRVLQDILLAARTPAGLASYLGEMYDRTGRPLAGPELLTSLMRVDKAGLTRAFTLLLDVAPTRAEVRP